jgi:hypothetical protein
MVRPSIRTFVSYSHEDRGIVEPIIRLLRITRNDVFWDCQSIPPGTLWRKEIDAALNEADIIVIFWCHHAEQSSEVEKEWRAGHALGKRLLPVLLDQTRMPRSLGRYQAVDFRSIVSSGHHTGDQGEPKQETSLNANALPILLGASLVATAKWAWDTISRVAQGDYNALLYYAPGAVWLIGGVAFVVMVARAIFFIHRERKQRRIRRRDEIRRMAQLLYLEVRGLGVGIGP